MLIAAMVAGVLSIAVLLRRDAPGALWASVLLGAIALWSGGYAYEVLAPELSRKIVAAQAQYFGILAAPAAFLMMVLTFTRHQRVLSGRWWWLLAAEPAVMLAVVWTNGSHGMLWASIELEQFGAAELLVYERGPVFYANVLYSYGLLLASVVTLAIAAVRGGSRYRPQTVLILVGAITPWAANAVSVAGLLSVPVNLTPFGFVVTGVLTAIAVTRHSMFDLVALGRAAVMDSIRPGVVVLDETGSIVEMNPAAQLMAGTPDDALGRPVGEVLTDFGNLLAEAELPSIHHVELAGPDGPRYYEVRLSALGSPGLRHRGRLVVLRDTTPERLFEVQLSEANARLEEQVQERTAQLRRELQERKTTELALRESNDRLERTMGRLEEAQQQVVQEERARALGEMASGIAHEFNNTLMPIVGYAQLLAEDPDLLNGETSRLYVENIRIAANDATEVASRMKEFYLPTTNAGELVALDLNELIRRSAALTEPRWKTQPEADGWPVRLLLDLEEGALVVGDATKLREVFTNLIFNAVDAMARGRDDPYTPAGDRGERAHRRDRYGHGHVRRDPSTLPRPVLLDEGRAGRGPRPLRRAWDHGAPRRPRRDRERARCRHDDPVDAPDGLARLRVRPRGRRADRRCGRRAPPPRGRRRPQRPRRHGPRPGPRGRSRGLREGGPRAVPARRIRRGHHRPRHAGYERPALGGGAQGD